MFRKVRKIVASTFMVVALMLVLSVGVSAATTTSKTIVRTNLRVKAASTSKSLAKVPVGSKVVVLSKTSKWTRVIYNNRVGYICTPYIKTTTVTTTTTKKYSASYFKKMGVIKWNGWKWTWYSQKVLPGKGLKIPGRHVNANGYVCDKNGYICLASTSKKKGTVVSTPFGAKGKVYDSGCSKGIFDVYVNW